MSKNYLRSALILILIISSSIIYAQDNVNNQSSLPANSTLTLATFTTISTKNKLGVNPFISGSIGNFYFENRYNYEAPNSASVNAGWRLNQKLAGFDITPIAGLIVGGFQGMNAEVQASRENEHWYFSLDNQYCFEYADKTRSFNYNWLVGRFKLTKFFRIGLTTQFTKPVNQKGVFDRGLTTSILYKNIAFNVYAFNYEEHRRSFFISLRYNLKLN
jgi:hypothetical protein